MHDTKIKHHNFTKYTAAKFVVLIVLYILKKRVNRIIC